MQAYFSPEEAEKLLTAGTRSVLCLSYGWHTGPHPDPRGLTLTKLRRYLQSDPSALSCGLFWDNSSLYQPEKTDDEQESMGKALMVMSKFYASITGTAVLMQKEVPARLPGDEASFAFRNTFLDTLLLAEYTKGQATFRSDSMTNLAIVKEVVTKEATSRKIQIQITVDARDAALAFANAAERPDSVDGKILLIGGDDSHLNLHRDVEDDILQAIGLGRLGPQASLPGDPDDDRGWSFTGWLDTTESQALLDYQHHSWARTVDWVASSQPRAVRVIAGALGPLARPVVRTALTLQRRAERRGPYADPWTLISAKLGSGVLASNVDPAPT